MAYNEKEYKTIFENINLLYDGAMVDFGTFHKKKLTF